MLVGWLINQLATLSNCGNFLKPVKNCVKFDLKYNLDLFKMELKTCTICKIPKNIDQYGTFKKKDLIKTRSECKQCRTIRESQRNKNNPKRQEYVRKYKNNNKEQIREYENARIKEKRQIDLHFKIRTDITSHIRHLLNGSRKTLDSLECTRDQLLKWFEYQFNAGISWSNQKEWQVDHVIPLAFFNLENKDQFKLACHWSNIRPINKTENISKSNKIIRESILNHIEIIKKFINLHNGYQTSMETCWWLRVELSGNNAQDDKDLENLLKWIIRSEAPNP